MELVLLVGLPGAGKTSFFRQRFAETHVHVSGALIRRVYVVEAREPGEFAVHARGRGTGPAPRAGPAP
jgi:hypothetical protein